MKKNTTQTIDEKIAFMECLKEVIRSAEISRECYGSHDENGNSIPPVESTCEYEKHRYKAYTQILEHLYNLI